MQGMAQKIAISYAYMLAIPTLVVGVFWGATVIIPSLRFDPGLFAVTYLCLASAAASAHAVKGFAAYVRWYWGLVAPVSIVCLLVLVQMPYSGSFTYPSWHLLFLFSLSNC